MKTYTGYFYEAISRRVEFATEAESEDEARANVKDGNATFDIDESNMTALDDYPKEIFFDGQPQPVTISPEDAQELCDLLDALASHAGGDEGLGSDLAIDIESARKLLQP